MPGAQVHLRLSGPGGRLVGGGVIGTRFQDASVDLEPLVGRGLSRS
jgi:hypothetical protein